MSATAKEPWVPRKVANAGLEVDYEQDPEDETWSYTITKSGSVLQTRAGFANPNSVSCGVANWFKKYYGNQERRPPRKEPQNPLPALGPGTSQLHQMMNARADDNESQAVRLREQADRLEFEAKKLRAAAEVLAE